MNKFSLYLPDGKRKPFSLTTPTKNVTPDEFYRIIKEGEIQIDQINAIRELSKTKEASKKNKDEITKNKEFLAGSRMSGIFVGGVNDSHLTDYSNRIVLDIDKIHGKVEETKEKIKNDPFTEAVFVSCSSAGLAVVVKVEMRPEDVSKESHRQIFFALEKYYFNEHGLEIDQSCKNLSRFRYVSHDPNIYVDFDSLPWTKRLEESYKKTKPKATPPKKQTQLNLDNESRVLEIAVEKIKNAPDGEKHSILRDVSFMVGGYVGGGFVNRQLATDTLIDAILSKNPADPEKAEQTIISGIEKGELNPLKEPPFHKTEQPIKPPKEAGRWWVVKHDKNGNVKGYEYSMSAYTDWLQNKYGVYRFTKSNGEREVVQVDNGVMRLMNRDLLHDLLNEYFQNQDESLHSDIVLNSTKKKEFFDTKNGLTGLADILTTDRTTEFKERDSELLFFQNCIVKVTKNGLETMQYKDFNGLIWESQVIQRDFDPNPEKGEFETFIEKLSGHALKSFQTAIGYMMHSFKSQSMAKALVIHDQNLSDLANGGTGKSLFIKSLRYYKSFLEADGKRIKSNDAFLFENVNESTQILFIDDIRRGFNFETVYNMVTGDFPINKKGKSIFSLAFKDSPKIAISTNYTIKKNGGSDERRVFNLEVTNYFNGVTNRVYDHFGHDLFDDWTGPLSIEWSKMDHYIINCISLYLREGLINQKFVSLAEKEFQVECGEEFIAFLDEFTESGQLVTSTYEDKGRSHFTQKALRKAFIDYLFENRYSVSYYQKLSGNEYYRRLKVWADFRNFEIVSKKSNGSKGFSVRNNEKIIEKVHG